MWSSGYIFFAVTLSYAECMTVARLAQGDGSGIASSIDYFTNAYETDAFCSLRGGFCSYGNNESKCFSCECQKGQNFYSEAVGCLAFSDLQNKLQDDIGMKCRYGINELSKEKAEEKLAAFSTAEELNAGFELQGMYPGSLQISQFSVKCRVQKLMHINVNGKVLAVPSVGNKTVFEIEKGSKTRKGYGAKEFNIKVLKYVEDENHWRKLQGKLLILYITCFREDFSDVEESCFMFSVNGTDSIFETTSAPSSTYLPSGNQGSYTKEATTPQSRNSTEMDGSRTLRGGKSPYLVPVIAGVAVSLIVIIIVCLGLFFIKRGKGGRHRTARKGKSEEVPTTEPKPNSAPGDYDYADPDKVKFKQKKKGDTTKSSTNPYYRSADAPPEVREAKNLLYEPKDKPLKHEEEVGDYQPLVGLDNPDLYNECFPMNSVEQEGGPAYVEVDSPDSPKYQPLGGRDASPEYKGLYKVPRTQGHERKDPPGSAEYETYEEPGSPVYREVYPDWPLDKDS